MFEKVVCAFCAYLFFVLFRGLVYCGGVKKGSRSPSSGSDAAVNTVSFEGARPVGKSIKLNDQDLLSLSQRERMMFGYG